jgi:P-type conjugative transfer ATPase TrbB
VNLSDTHKGLERSRQMLRTALGPLLLARLEDPGIGEVLLNPDGRVWTDRFDVGLVDSGLTIAPGDAERIVRLVAHHVAAEIHAERPRLSAELPDGGERFEGLMPPLVAAPSFSIRKPASLVFRLDDYVQSGVMTEREGQVLADAVRARENVLVVGQTSSGKTTLVNALLAEVALSGDRVVLLEDLRELQCPAADQVAARTREGVATLTDLVRSALRLRPDRIIIGEVRGPEALDLIKAWGTGHPGGVATLHAGSALGALLRLEQLIQEAVVTVPRGLIAETIDLIAVLAGRGQQRRLIELARLEGQAPDGGYHLSPA